jgi:acetyl esterase/lipase
LVIPGGVGSAGGPIGFQLVAQRFREDVLLRAGHLFQRADEELEMASLNDFGPHLFMPEAISAETREFNAKLEQAVVNAPARWELTLEVERNITGAGAGLLPAAKPVERAEMLEIPGPGGEIPLRIIKPLEGPIRGVYLHFHGGGFAFGSAAGQDPMLDSITRNANVVAISVDYRLAPEHPYPAGPADAEAAAWWIVNNAGKLFGTDRIVLGGESAGSTLSVLAALRLRDRKRWRGLAGLNLSQGAYDFGMTPSARAASEGVILDRRIIERHFERYIGKQIAAGQVRDPEVSPLYADLRNLPRALFTVGTLDPVLDDTLFMHARWLAAGNQGTLDVYPGGVHAFNFLPTDLGRKASRAVEAFIGKCCG